MLYARCPTVLLWCSPGAKTFCLEYHGTNVLSSDFSGGCNR